MITNITLEQALSKASKVLQKKMMYSIDLLRKAENLHLLMVVAIKDIISHSLEERTVRHSIILQSLQE